ncbi:MAG: PSP1 domain-containing protein [Saprospiraceae bacterium]
MKKKFTNEERITLKVLRKANERDLEKLNEARLLEQETMVRARVIARTLGLDMKLGDVEFQGDKKKATFYYTAEGRVDFRELVKEYAKRI